MIKIFKLIKIHRRQFIVHSLSIQKKNCSLVIIKNLVIDEKLTKKNEIHSIIYSTSIELLFLLLPRRVSFNKSIQVNQVIRDKN